MTKQKENLLQWCSSSEKLWKNIKRIDSFNYRVKWDGIENMISVEIVEI